jgi:UMF1 family MFS transporter
MEDGGAHRRFAQLWHTARGLRAYPLTLAFLGAYLVYNDGIQTVISQVAVYADKQLKLTQSAQVQTILLVQLLAFFGSVALGQVAARIGAWKTVLGSLVIWAVVAAGNTPPRLI